MSIHAEQAQNLLSGMVKEGLISTNFLSHARLFLETALAEVALEQREACAEIARKAGEQLKPDCTTYYVALTIETNIRQSGEAESRGYDRGVRDATEGEETRTG